MGKVIIVKKCCDCPYHEFYSTTHDIFCKKRNKGLNFGKGQASKFIYDKKGFPKGCPLKDM